MKIIGAKGTTYVSINTADPNELKQAKEKYWVSIGQATQQYLDISNNPNHVETKGVILASKPSGNIVKNSDSEIELQVKVTRTVGSTYEVTVTKGTPQNGLAFTIQGSIVHVFYLPDDEQNIVIGFFA